jgi:hypothetical protein
MGQILIIAGTGIAGLAFFVAGAMLAYHAIQRNFVGEDDFNGDHLVAMHKIVAVAVLVVGVGVILRFMGR